MLSSHALRRAVVICALAALGVASPVTAQAVPSGGPVAAVAQAHQTSVQADTPQPLDPRVADALRLSRARAILASSKPLTISVLGDSVGNDPGEWVSKWAESLASDRVVTVRHFDWQRVAWKSLGEVFAPDHETSKAQVTVWNFGWPGGTPLRAAQHLKVGVPAKPDLALVSFGHNVGPKAVVPHYEALASALSKRWGAVPTVTTLAHMTPIVRPGQAEGRVILLRWLRARGLPYVDERSVFDVALAEQRSVFHDAVHPNLLGYRLISDLVEAALSEPSADGPPPATYRPALAKATLTKLTKSTGARATTLQATYTVRNAYGRPFAHAWVLLRMSGPGGTTASLETDANGRVTGSVRIDAGAVGNLTATATDGLTTVTSRATTVRAR